MSLFINFGIEMPDDSSSESNWSWAAFITLLNR